MAVSEGILNGVQNFAFNRACPVYVGDREQGCEAIRQPLTPSERVSFALDAIPMQCSASLMIHNHQVPALSH
jgi:hypothetical protein